MKTKLLGIFCLLVILIWSFTGSVTAKSTMNSNLSPEQKTAELYSQNFNVSLEEAYIRLELQNAFPDLEPALIKNESNTFGGLWIQHEPDFRVTVAFTDKNQDLIAKYNEYIPAKIAPYIETKNVIKTLKELQQDQENFVSSLKASGIITDSWVDVTTNEVVVCIRTIDKDFYVNTIASENIITPDRMRVQEVEALTCPTTDIYGGLTLDLIPYIYHYVTSGFAVEDNSSDDVGIITAGHASDDLYYSPYSLTFESEQYWGNYDVQWHTVSQYLTVTPDIQIDQYGTTRGIYGQINRGSQVINAFYGKYGKTTYYTAGQLVSKTFAPSSVPNAQYTWMLIYNYFEHDDLVAGGDSGGPWFVNNSALGITHGELEYQGNQFAVYMAIDYISGVGVSLMTN